MKKILLGLFAFSLVFAAVSFTSHKAQAENIFTRFLSFGSRGEDVKALQEVLKNEGLLGTAATGYFGTATKQAVTELQIKNNLEPVGKVGPKTIETLNKTYVRNIVSGASTGVITNKTVAPTTTTKTEITAKIIPTVAAPVCISTSPASIAVVTPNGGETFIAGQQAKVRWTTCNVPATSNINIMITMNNTSIASAAGATPNDGIEAIDLPTQANLPAGTAMIYGNVYKVNLFVSGMNVSDSSDNLFTINGGTMAGCTPTSSQAIQVTSPNGGETYTAGQQITVTWVSCNISANTVAVGMLGLGSANMTGAFPNMINIVVPNTGSALYTLPVSSLFYSPNGLLYGQPVYEIVVYVPGGIQDESDNWFTITPCVIKSDLRLGSSGSEVTCLQNKLNVTPATGYFGAVTEAAVKAFQFAHNLPANGFVGAMMRALLMTL